MRSIIFANYLARDTTRLSPTLDVEHHHVRFLGDLVLNLWDCGGQDAFYESYFERDRETIFRSVELLIYVFDIESDNPEKDFDHFCGVLEAIEENSPDARIFVLVHKMDLVAVEDRETILEERKRLISESCLSCGVENFQCFGTSIWDETLYKAWSEIVTNLIPNIGLLETHLNNFCRICDADEVVLFERATFLVISHAQASDNPSEDEKVESTPNGTMVPPDHIKRTQHFDPHRFEKISNIVKQFKLSCGKAQSQVRVLICL
jgi:Ras-related GTP-binding protein A/B